VTSATANRAFDLRPQRINPAPLRSGLRAFREAHGGPWAVPLDIEIQERLVLKALLERFGGEVTASALTRHLSTQQGRAPFGFGPGLLDVLQSLDRIGAVTLEANGEDDLIVRLLPHGADYCA
jgi:hypothetical protein